MSQKPGDTEVTEIALHPQQSVEIWDSVVFNGVVFYALLNRNSNFRLEIWRRNGHGLVERLWAGDGRYRYASVSIATSGASLIVLYSRAKGKTNSTPFLPYMMTLKNVVSE